MKISRATLVTIIVVVLVLAGLVAYAINRDNRADNRDLPTQKDAQTSQNETQNSLNNPEEQVREDQNRVSVRVIDGVGIPESVLGHIETQYPDYIIEDADREVDIELYYDESWNLIRTSTD